LEGIDCEWFELVVNVLVAGSESGTGVFGALDALVGRLGAKFYPDENAFPVLFLCNELESLNQSMQYHGDGWVIRAMCKVGVPFVTLFQHYNKIFEAGQGTHHVLEQICFLLNEWLEVVSAGGVVGFPAREVEEALSRYVLVSLPNDTLGTISRLESIRGRVMRRFS
jgi:hypothetical protein